MLRDHLLVRDFNLYYLLQLGIKDLVYYNALVDLMQIVNKAHLQLLSLVGQITQAKGLSKSILDLAFKSQIVLNQLIKYQVNTNLDHGSNHLLVKIVIALKTQLTKERAARNQKQIDPKAVKVIARELIAYDYQEALPQGIKTYVEYLLAFL